MKKRMKWRPSLLFSVKAWQQGSHTWGMSLRKVTCSNLPINTLGLFLLWTGWTSTTSPVRLNREIYMYHQTVRSDVFISSAILASIWFVDRWSHICSPMYCRSDYLCWDCTCTYMYAKSKWEKSVELPIPVHKHCVQSNVTCMWEIVVNGSVLC